MNDKTKFNKDVYFGLILGFLISNIVYAVRFFLNRETMIKYTSFFPIVIFISVFFLIVIEQYFNKKIPKTLFFLLIVLLSTMVLNIISSSFIFVAATTLSGIVLALCILSYLYLFLGNSILQSFKMYLITMAYLLPEIIAIVYKKIMVL